MPCLSKHDIVPGNRRSWTVVRKLGEGQFAEVYEGRDVEDYTRKFAIKIEKNVRILKVEQRALAALQHVPAMCKLYESGTMGEKMFLVLELLGCNLAEYRRMACADSGGHFSLPDVKVLGTALLKVLQGMHGAGWIHRDVKPANFCLTRDPLPRLDATNVHARHGYWRAIDFGLARKHLDEHGNAYQARADAAFRGSRTYASVYAHRETDLGRRDDLWSWYYMLVELWLGGLPWREPQCVMPYHHHHHHLPSCADGTEEKEKDIVVLRKEAAMDDPQTMAPPGEPLPALFVDINTYLKTLAYEDTPDYNHLLHLLRLTPDDQQHLLTRPAPLHTPMMQRTASTGEGQAESASGYAVNASGGLVNLPSVVHGGSPSAHLLGVGQSPILGGGGGSGVGGGSGGVSHRGASTASGGSGGGGGGNTPGTQGPTSAVTQQQGVGQEGSTAGGVHTTAPGVRNVHSDNPHQHTHTGRVTSNAPPNAPPKAAPKAAPNVPNAPNAADTRPPTVEHNKPPPPTQPNSKPPSITTQPNSKPPSITTQPSSNKPSTVMASILQNSAATRKALIAQKEAAAKQQQAQLQAAAAATNNDAADVKQMLSALSATLAHTPTQTPAAAAGVHGHLRKHDMHNKRPTTPSINAPASKKPKPVTTNSKPPTPTTTTTPAAPPGPPEQQGAPASQQRGSLGVKLRPRSATTRQYNMVDASETSEDEGDSSNQEEQGGEAGGADDEDDKDATSAHVRGGNRKNKKPSRGGANPADHGKSSDESEYEQEDGQDSSDGETKREGGRGPRRPPPPKRRAAVATQKKRQQTGNSEDDDDMPLHQMVASKQRSVTATPPPGRGARPPATKRGRTGPAATTVACTGLPSVHAGKGALVQAVDAAVDALMASPGDAADDAQHDHDDAAGLEQDGIEAQQDAAANMNSTLTEEQRGALDVLIATDAPTRLLVTAALARSTVQGSVQGPVRGQGALEAADAAEWLESLATYVSSIALKTQASTKRATRSRR